MNFDWRHVIALTMVVLFGVTGGIVWEAARPCEGALTVTEVDDPSSEAEVIPYEELPDNDALKTAIQRGIASDASRSGYTVPRSEFQTLRTQMASYPKFGDTWYIDYQNTTVTVKDWCSE